MTNASFTSDSITINGSTFPAEYSITPSGKVFAFVELPENGEAKGLRIRFDAVYHYADRIRAALAKFYHARLEAEEMAEGGMLLELRPA